MIDKGLHLIKSRSRVFIFRERCNRSAKLPFLISQVSSFPHASPDAELRRWREEGCG
jgi:hypothetical protein